MGTQTRPRARVVFGDYELDCRTGVLSHNGTTLALQPQPAKVLSILVSRTGEVVTREELAEQIWGSDTHVDFEHGLNFAIGKIRKALEDDAAKPRYLETIPKRGYRFIAAVIEKPDSAATPEVAIPESVHAVLSAAPAPMPAYKRQLRYAVVALVCIVVITAYWITVRKPLANAVASGPITSIAVLPLRNLSSDPEQEYFSDGITDELITDLAKSGKLRVISHTSVERYKGTTTPSQEIAKRLGVDAIVEGTVMRSADRVRITAQLIDGRSDQHLWADKYERDLRDVLRLQDEVAGRIAAEIGTNIVSGGQNGLAVRERKVSPDAYEAYLKGNFYWNQSNCDGSTRGLEHFETAAAEDPGFAPTYVGMAEAYFTLADWGCSPQRGEFFSKSKAAATHALELDSTLGSAHAWLGSLAYFYEWDWANAEKEYSQAIAMDPSYSPGHLSYAVFLVSMGRQDLAIREMRTALALDPTSELTNMVSVHILYLAHRYDEAIAQANATTELHPDSWGAYYWLGAAYERRTMYQQACDAYIKSKMLQHVSGRDLDAFRNACRRASIQGFWREELAQSERSGGDVCLRSVAHAHLDDKERTLEFLGTSVERHCEHLRALKVDPLYDSMRGEPRFQKALTRLDLR